MVNQIFTFLWIVMNGDDVRLAEGEAAHVLREIDEFLQGHAIRRSLIVGGQQLFLIVDLVNVLPASTGEWLENRRPPDVVQQTVPVHGIFQVVERLRSD